jgi:hypothetical protein
MNTRRIPTLDRVEATVPMPFSADETTDLGGDSASPASDDYGPKNSAFTGRVRWVHIDLAEAPDDTDHIIGTGGAAQDRHGEAVAGGPGDKRSQPLQLLTSDFRCIVREPNSGVTSASEINPRQSKGGES